MRPLAFDSLIFFTLIALDRLSKNWTLDSLQGLPSIELFQLSGVECFLTYATNTGAAWGILSDFPSSLLFIRILFVFFLAYAYFSYRVSRVSQCALMLILSGAISNMIDTALYGHVVDMIHVRFWGFDYPIFNIADSAITSGATLFIVSSVWRSASPPSS